jgi:TP901 family phage tail tape measure protein
MAEDTNANIRVDIDTTAALASIKNLQRQISAFHTNMAKGGAAAAATSLNLQQGLLNSINRTGQFSATIKNVKSTTESFTTALEKNKLSMREYFRYSGAATKTFGRLFTSEFDTINKVARERVKDLQTQYIKMGRDANGAIRSIAVRPLALDMESLSTKTQIAAQKQALLNQMLKQGSTNLLNFGKNTQWAGRQLMVGFTVPLTMFGTVAAKTFMDMEKQAIRFKRVYGEMFTTTEETNRALEEIKNLASQFTKYGVAVEKTMELAADVAATGKMGADLTAQVANATRLAVLGGVEQQEALKATISLTDAFGTSAEDLTKRINFLNAVENQTVTSIEDLTIAIPKAGPVVQQLGGDVQDLTFFLTAMREGGINASEGANALKSGLASLINPTGVAAEMLQGFGINLKGIVDANKGNVKGIVIDFAKALDTLDPLNRAQAIEQLFGKFQFARLSTLFQNVIKEGNQASRVLKLTNATTEELAILAERELKKVEDSPMFKFQKAVEDIKVTLVPLGEAFLKAVTPVLEFGTKILEKFNELDAGAKGFVVGLTAIAGVIGPVFLMGFGLIANGVANIIKMFTFFKTALNKAGTASTELGMQTDYMTQQQLEASAVAASLNQVHQRLTQTFSSEAAAINNLTVAYRKALAAQNGMTGGAISRTRPPKKFASGVVSVPGPKGAGDIVPAMLAPGEAIIPAKQAKKYAPFIQDMISGNIPGFRNGVFLGMPKSAKSVTKSRSAADEIYEMFKKSSFVNTPPTVYGHQISPTSGHSFPIFGLGGVYQKGNKQVFVKPVMDEKAALAEIRATTIARQAHGLKSPDQRIVVIRDPMDVKRQRKFLALESDLDPTFVNNQPLGVFNEEQYFKQLTASLLRGDKDLSASNVYKDVLADVGPAGVFDRASGLRDYSKNMPSMEEQALINLLGVKGGAKRAFAESTLSLMGGLTSQQYHQKMIGEIQRVLPKLKQTIASFKLTNPTDVGMYDDMVRRLEAGLNVDWGKFHSVHSAVKIPKPKAPKVVEPTGYAKGVVSVPGPKGAGDVMPAMLSPGEAVIPAKMAKKYAPLINGIITGNVPGFEEGLLTYGNAVQIMPSRFDGVDLNAQSGSQAGADRSQYISGMQSVGAKTYSPLLVEIASKILGPKATDSAIAELASSGKFKNFSEKLYSGVISGLSENTGPVKDPEFHGLSSKIANSLASTPEFGDEFGAATKSVLSERTGYKDETGKRASLSTGAIAPIGRRPLYKGVPFYEDPKRRSLYQNVYEKFGGTMAPKEYQLSHMAPPTPENVSSLESLPNKSKSLSTAIERKKNRQVWLAKNRFTGKGGQLVPEDTSPEQLRMLSGIPETAEERKLLAEERNNQKKAKTAGVSQKKANTQAHSKLGELDGETYEKSRAETLKGADPYPEATTRTSPHKKAAVDGRDDAKAYSKAKREQLTKEEKYVRNLQSNYGGAQVVTAQMRGERKQVEKLMKQDRVAASQAKARAVQVANQQRMAAASNQALYGTTDFTPQMRQERKRQQAAEKAANAKAAAERKTLAIQKAATVEAQKQAAVSSRTAATAPRQARPGMGMGGMAMVASGAMMAGSMVPGTVGEISQQLMMPAMLASMLLPMAGAFAPVIAGLGALAAGAWALKNAFDSAEKAARENAFATGSGTDAIKGFAEFAGKASAGEIMDKRRSGALERFGVQSGKESFGNLFLQSDAAKPILEGLKASVASGATKESMVATTKNQLATAVASGALTRDEAASIAGSLGEALGDRSFGIKVVGELDALVGIDGRNLLKNPIEIRVRLLEETNSKLEGMATGSSMLQAKGQQVAGGALAAAGGALGAQLGAAGLAALNITRLGAMAGPIGAIVGGIAGAATGAVMLYQGVEKAGKFAGAMNAQGIIALQQNQEMLDSLDLEYQKRIANAKAAGDLIEAERLMTELQSGRQRILDVSKQTITTLVQQYQDADFAGINPMGESLDRTIDSMYKDNPLLQQVTTGARLAIQDSAGTAEQEYTLKLMLASGNIDPGTMSNLLGVFGNDQESVQKIIDISLKLGTADAGRAFALADLFEDKDMKKDFIARVQTKAPAQATKMLNMFETVQKSGGVLDMQMVLNAYMADPAAGDKLIRDLETFKQAQADGPITTTVINRVFGAEAAEAVAKDWEYFNSLDKDMQFTYMTLVQTTFETIEKNPEAYNTWKAVQAKGADTSKAAYVAAMSYKGTEATVRANNMNKETETPSSGGGRQADPLDNILKSLQNVRKASINALGGTKELFRLFENGKNISAFSGIENQLLALTSNTDFANFISGLDKKEQDLFITIKKGNVELTQRGRLLEKAYQANSIGNFVLSQQKLVISSKNELIARNLLIDAGYSYIEASELARDATIREAYADAASIKNKKNRAEAIRNLNKALKEGADAQKANRTFEEIFDDGFGKAMEAFEAEEKRLTLEFDVKVKADKALVAAAENEIAKIQYIIDDYEADLKGIEDQEEKINKTYDDKLEALEKVRSANQKILEQEKGKLSVAEAITRGDLYAAAQAAQQARETSASGFFASQTSAIEAGRERALGQVRGAMGLSREQVQEKIKKLSDDIFYIEEKTLEPANERIRLAQVELDKRISEITVLGNTKTQWEGIKSEIDLARVNSDAYKKSIEEALAVVEKLKLAWAGVGPAKVEVDGPPKDDDKKDTPAGVDLLNSPKSVSDRAASQAAFEASGMSASQYIKFVDSQAEAKAAAEKKAQIAADQKSSKAAQVKSGLSASDYARQVSRREEAKIPTPSPKLVVTGNSTVQRSTAAPAPKPTGPALRNLLRNASGGLVNYLSNGGAPKFAKPSWAKAMGTDIVPAMLTPGEFVISRPAVSKIGVKSLNSINNGEYPGGSVYNYNLSVNVSSMSDPNDIAQTVMAQIRRVESQRIRSNKF